MVKKPLCFSEISAWLRKPSMVQKTFLCFTLFNILPAVIHYTRQPVAPRFEPLDCFFVFLLCPFKGPRFYTAKCFLLPETMVMQCNVTYAIAMTYT